MNRMLTLLTVLVFAGLALPSCGVSLVKRQHRSGYYVNVNPRKHKIDGNAAREAEKQREETAQAQPEKQPEVLRPAEQASTVLETSISEKSTNEEIALADGTEAVATTTDIPETAPPAEKRRPELKEHAISSAFAGNNMEQTAQKIKKMETKVKEMKAKSGRGNSSSGLSLFWIVILVLLILWALGFWGWGWSGGLVHLLLVIALILLILWLLGVI